MTHHRLTVVRSDGVSHTSDFIGWHSETGVYHYFNEAKRDTRTLAAIVFQSADEGKTWYCRSQFDSASYGNEPRGGRNT